MSESASGMTIVELVAAYWRHMQTYYRKDGQPTSEVTSIRRALDPLQNMYGDTVVDDFGPLKLKAYRQSLIDKDLSRKYINDRADRVRRMFAWGVENQLVATEVLTALRAMTGLRKGRSEAHETEPVRPVAEEHNAAKRRARRTPMTPSRRKRAQRASVRKERGKRNTVGIRTSSGIAPPPSCPRNSGWKRRG